MTWAMVPSRTCSKTSSLTEEKAFLTGKSCSPSVTVCWPYAHARTFSCVTATSALQEP